MLGVDSPKWNLVLYWKHLTFLINQKDDIRWIILPEKEKAIDNEILGAYTVFKLENIS